MRPARSVSQHLWTIYTTIQAAYCPSFNNFHIMTANAHSAIGIIGSSTASQLASFSRPTPRPGPEQVLAKTLLVGHTPLSQWQVDFRLFIGEEDHVLGGNVVGEILEVGAGVRKELRVGSIVSMSIAGAVERLCIELKPARTRSWGSNSPCPTSGRIRSSCSSTSTMPVLCVAPRRDPRARADHSDSGPWQYFSS